LKVGVFEDQNQVIIIEESEQVIGIRIAVGVYLGNLQFQLAKLAD
jgi:hypothetical protein